MKERVRMNLEKLQFRFAKTMPEIPHEYVVRTQDNETGYVELFETIVMLGVIEIFKGRRYRLLVCRRWL